MTSEEVAYQLTRAGAILTNGHFVYASGKHGSAYVNKDAIFPHWKLVADLCDTIANHFARSGIEVVVGPGAGGAVLAHETAAHLTFGRRAEEPKAFCAYAEKTEDEAFVLRRGYDRLVSGQRVLVVDDVLTTGGSAKAVVEAVRAAGGEVVGVGAVCNRGGVQAADVGNVPKLFALVDLDLDSWEAAACPLCQKGIPVNTDFGHGRTFHGRKYRQFLDDMVMETFFI